MGNGLGINVCLKFGTCSRTVEISFACLASQRHVGGTHLKYGLPECYGMYVLYVCQCTTICPLFSVGVVWALVCLPILTRWLLVRLMCFTKESVLRWHKYRAEKAASMVLVVTMATVVVVAVVGADKLLRRVGEE